jgi:hypothetical protein
MRTTRAQLDTRGEVIVATEANQRPVGQSGSRHSLSTRSESASGARGWADRRPAARRVSLRLRIAVWLTRGGLDRRIASGQDQLNPPRIELRTRQLTSTRARRRLARELLVMSEHTEHFIGYADGHPLALAAADVADLRRAKVALAALAHRFEEPAPVSASGIILARALVRRGIGGVLFDPSSEPTLSDRVAEALAAVEQSSSRCPTSSPRCFSDRSTSR